MKKIILICCIMFISADTFAADANPCFEIGSMTTDGGASHLMYMSGFEMTVKSTRTGFANVIRSGVYQVRGDEEIQGFYAWNISQQILKKNWWNLYAGFGFGVMNQVVDGDDKQQGGTMVEFGCVLFNKMPFGVGAKLFPVDDKGDKAFLYGRLTFSLP